MKLLHEWLYEEMQASRERLRDLEEQLLAVDLSRPEEYVHELRKDFSLWGLHKVANKLLEGYPAESAIRMAACEILEADHEEA